VRDSAPGEQPMSSGLLALLDDVVSLASVAAASLDDAASQAVQATGKAAGIVIDDTAVTPRYVIGFSAERELPIIGKIAKGSLKNKLLYLLPAALVLTVVAPWSITPLLMLGGAYLCFEGYEKVHHWVTGHDPSEDGSSSDAPAHGDNAVPASPPLTPEMQAISAKAFEDSKVAGAIQTDMVLSAEIMAITLASITAPDLMTQALVLATVAVLVTVGVYGAVALIVKADDVGLSLAQNDRPASTLLGLRTARGATDAVLPEAGSADRALAPVTKAAGRGLVKGMPPFLNVLSVIGTLAMLWVGGGIIVHGLDLMGFSGPEHIIHGFAEAVGGFAPALGGAVTWLTSATASAMLGIIVGGLTAVAWTTIRPLLPSKAEANAAA
jgi:uncharacterized protein